MAHKLIEIGIGDFVRIEVSANDGRIFFHTAAQMPIQLGKVFYDQPVSDAHAQLMFFFFGTRRNSFFCYFNI